MREMGGKHNFKRGVGRYVGFTPMWERTICGFSCREAWVRSKLIKNSDFLSSIVNLEYGPLRSLEAL